MNRRSFMNLLAALPFGALFRRAPVERGTVPVTVFVAEELETAATFHDISRAESQRVLTVG